MHPLFLNTLTTCRIVRPWLATIAVLFSCPAAELKAEDPDRLNLDRIPLLVEIEGNFDVRPEIISEWLNEYVIFYHTVPHQYIVSGEYTILPDSKDDAFVRLNIRHVIGHDPLERQRRVLSSIQPVGENVGLRTDEGEVFDAAQEFDVIEKDGQTS